MEDKIARAELNLQRKLEWISRYDSRISFITGISIAMLGVLASASANVEGWSVPMYIFFSVACLLQLGSLIFVFLSQYPKTKSDNTSLIYFGTIGAMKSDEYKKRFKNTSDKEYFDDLLSQVHINSVILCQKFLYLKKALILILTSVIPWLFSIYLSKLFF